MTRGIGLGQWPEKPPIARNLMAVIRSLVDHTDIVLLDHAEERMRGRDIDMFDVRQVLKTGEIVGTIEPGINADEWKCKVTASPRFPEDKREIGVVTIVVRASRLLIKTVEWEVDI
jgi:hypothetical protein